MAKQKPEVSIRSYGIYTQWDEAAKELPRITEFTTRVYAKVDVEFGMIVNIKRAKNQKLWYCIYHPGISDAEGATRPPFDGEVYVKTADWDFFLGDTIWEPIEDKLGEWRLVIELDGKKVAEQTFEVFGNTGA